MWNRAVSALKEALRLKQELNVQDPMTLTHATLGVAYLVSPEGKNVAEATRHFEHALAAAERDRGLDAISRASVYVNAAVAGVGGGQNASTLLMRARTIVADNDTIQSAVSYNRGLMLGRSSAAPDKKGAVAEMENYLSKGSRSSAWWKIGYDYYERLVKEQGLMAKPAGAFESEVALRPVTSVKFGSGVVSLNDTMSDVRTRLGEAQPIRIYPGGDLVKLRYVTQGVEVIGTDRVIGIFLTDAGSPAVELRETGVGTRAKGLRVGMPQLELIRAIGRTEYLMPLVERDKDYHYYPHLGLAFRLAGGKVTEIAIVPVPLG
jgi:hypothetical protein